MIEAFRESQGFLVPEAKMAYLEKMGRKVLGGLLVNSVPSVRQEFKEPKEIAVRQEKMAPLGCLDRKENAVLSEGKDPKVQQVKLALAVLRVRLENAAQLENKELGVAQANLVFPVKRDPRDHKA